MRRKSGHPASSSGNHETVSHPALLVCASACAQGIEVPAVGVIVDSSRDLRQVQGVAGNFLLGPASMSGVLSAACSEQLCLAKTDSKILSATGETVAPRVQRLRFDGNEAIVLFPERVSFARWHDDTLESLDWAVEGEVPPSS